MIISPLGRISGGSYWGKSSTKTWNFSINGWTRSKKLSIASRVSRSNRSSANRSNSELSALAALSVAPPTPSAIIIQNAVAFIESILVGKQGINKVHSSLCRLLLSETISFGRKQPPAQIRSLVTFFAELIAKKCAACSQLKATCPILLKSCPFWITFAALHSLQGAS